MRDGQVLAEKAALAEALAAPRALSHRWVVVRALSREGEDTRKGTHIIRLATHDAAVDAVDVSLEVLTRPEPLVAALVGALERLVRLGRVRAFVGPQVTLAGESRVTLGALERALRGGGGGGSQQGE